MKHELLQKYLAGNATETEKNEIQSWIEADSGNRKEFLRYRRLYDATIWSDREKYQTIKGKKRKLKLSPGHYVIDFLKVAAVVLIAMLSTLYVHRLIKQPAQKLSQIVEVPQGQYVNLTLSDGTKVTLNENSKLMIPTVFESDSRTVELDGEGYFEVSHNAKKPFLVRTNKCVIKVLGTKFNVLAFRNSDIFETSLLEGSVEVTSTKLNKKQLLRPNEKVVLKNDHLLVSTMQNTNELLWKDGILVFENRPLSEILDKLNAYYTTRITLHNKSLANRTCTAKFRQKEGVDHILRVLKKSYGFDFEHNEKINSIDIY